MILREMVEARKQDIERRLNSGFPDDCGRPMFSASNINYELSDRTRAISYGGIGLIHKLARESGLIDAVDEARLKVWARQPKPFFEQAIIDADGHLVGTAGQCKEGMDIAYDGTWGYHPLLVSLANTGEVLSLVNRSGNRPSHEGAAAEYDRVIALCRRAGFGRILLRGDTDFSQTEHLDGWDEDGVHGDDEFGVEPESVVGIVAS
jgi:hypothetical protein